MATINEATMNIAGKFTQDFTGNTATIEKVAMRPYKGAKKTTGYRLWVTDNEGFIFYVSCHETYGDAMYAMQELGNGYKVVA